MPELLLATVAMTGVSNDHGGKGWRGARPPTPRPTWPLSCSRQLH